MSELLNTIAWNKVGFQSPGFGIYPTSTPGCRLRRGALVIGAVRKPKQQLRRPPQWNLIVLLKKKERRARSTATPRQTFRLLQKFFTEISYELALSCRVI